MHPSPQPALPQSQQAMYIDSEDLVIGTNGKIATVAKNISKLSSPVEAEVSQSPTLTVPLASKDNDCFEETDSDFPADNAVCHMPHRGIIRKKLDTSECPLVMAISSKPSASHTRLKQALYQGLNLIIELTILLLGFILGKFASVIDNAFSRIIIVPCERCTVSYVCFDDPLVSQVEPGTHKVKHKDKDQYLMGLVCFGTVGQYYRETGDRKRPKYNNFEVFETTRPPDRA